MCTHLHSFAFKHAKYIPATKSLQCQISFPGQNYSQVYHFQVGTGQNPEKALEVWLQQSWVQNQHKQACHP